MTLRPQKYLGRKALGPQAKSEVRRSLAVLHLSYQRVCGFRCRDDAYVIFLPLGLDDPTHTME